MATVPAVLTQLQTIQAAIPGVTRAYNGNRLPDSLEDVPAFVTFPPAVGEIEIDAGYGLERWTYTLGMRLYVQRQDLADATERATALINPVMTAFRLNCRLGNLVTVAEIRGATIGAADYGGVQYLVVDFPLRVRDHVPAVFAS